MSDKLPPAGTLWKPSLTQSLSFRWQQAATFFRQF